MPPKPPAEVLADAVIRNVEHGIYPDSEDVVSAELPSSALPRLLDTIQKARDEVKAGRRCNALHQSVHTY
jgi:protein transport protein DSL1/ZW10